MQATEDAQAALPLRNYLKSTKLAEVLYEIRGPVLEAAKKLEAEGHSILKLNIGNPAPFGFVAPVSLLTEVREHLDEALGYGDAKGLPIARDAIRTDAKNSGILDVDLDDIYIGNGVSELIVMAMQGLLNVGDEVLIPSPDYPLWTAAVTLAGGTPVHYQCDEAADWMPDIANIRQKTTDRTVGIVVINPNNPTGAVYEPDLLEDLVDWARERQLLLLADEIYSKVTYDDAKYIPLASLSDDVLTLTFDGLSKNYRAAGFRSGWLILSGPKERARDYVEGLNMLASMRLCANVPTQFAIPRALTGAQSIYAHTAVGGSLYQKREVAYDLITRIDGISCVKPKGALYMFPKIDTNRITIYDDQQMVLDMLNEHHILLVHGTGFNYPRSDHFRLVFLPDPKDLKTAMTKLQSFFSSYSQ